MSFRLFKHTWLGEDYTNHDENDVKDCLKKLIDPLVTGGCNWSWDTKHCPNSEPINLIPSSRVFAAFIKHTSGAKALIGYSLNGVLIGSQSDGTATSGHSFWDAGFLLSHVRVYNQGYGIKLTGLFFSFLTAKSVNNGSDFHPEYSISDENFYDSEMLPICSLTSITASVSSGTNYMCDNKYCASMIKRITDSQQCTHCIISDTQDPILILTSNLYGKNPCIALFGEIATSQKRYDYDVRNTNELRCYLGGSGISISGQSSSSYNYGEDSYNPSGGSAYVVGACELIYFTTSGTSITTTTPAILGYKWLSTTPRTGGTIYDELSVWTSLIKVINVSGLTQGQVYSNGEWCFLGGGDSSNNFNSMGITPDNGSVDCRFYGMAIAWDHEFNQSNRFI